MKIYDNNKHIKRHDDIDLQNARESAFGNGVFVGIVITILFIFTLIQAL